MTPSMLGATTKEIHAYWRTQAQQAPDHIATLADHNQRLLETRAIAGELKPDDRAADVGCGNGYSTAEFARRVAWLCGVDGVPEMVERARREHPLTNGEYRVGLVTKLPLPSGSLTAVITQRCLINLTTWDAQETALAEIFRVLRPGGRYLMCETTVQGLDRLNALRGRFDLAPIPVVWHNVLIDEDRLARWQERTGVTCTALHRFSTYYLVSRVIHPLLVAPAEPTWDAPINAIARRLTEEFPDLADGASYVSVRVLVKP